MSGWDVSGLISLVLSWAWPAALAYPTMLLSRPNSRLMLIFIDLEST